MSIDLICMGMNIKSARRRMRMTQFEFSEHINVHPNYVSQLECGRKIPSLTLLNRIQETLDLSWGELLDPPAPTAGQSQASNPELRRLVASAEKLDLRTVTALANLVSATRRAGKKK